MANDTGPVSSLLSMSCDNLLCASFDTLRLWSDAPKVSPKNPFRIVAGHSAGTISSMRTIRCNI